MAMAAIALGLLWCVQNIYPEKPEPERVALLVAGTALLAAGLRGWNVAPLAAWYAFLIAIPERLGRELVGMSDVLRATDEALDVVLAGGNPYTHVMQSTNPVGSPFVYPPGEFLFYLPAKLLAGDLTRVDSLAGIGIVALVAIAGLRVGFDHTALPAMVYASWGSAGWHSIGGANDVGASFVVVLALVAAVFASPSRAGRAAFLLSAVALGWSVAFKQFAILVAPPVLRWVAVSGAPWRRYALVAGATTAVMVLPYALRDPAAFISQQLGAITFHQNIWGENVLAALRSFADPEGVAPLVTVTAGAGLLAFGLLCARWRVPSLGAAALAGALAVTSALILARWTSQSYYVYVGAIVAAGLALTGVSRITLSGQTGRSETRPPPAPRARSSTVEQGTFDDSVRSQERAHRCESDNPVRTSRA